MRPAANRANKAAYKKQLANSSNVKFQANKIFENSNGNVFALGIRDTPYGVLKFTLE